MIGVTVSSDTRLLGVKCISVLAFVLIFPLVCLACSTGSGWEPTLKDCPLLAVPQATDPGSGFVDLGVQDRLVIWAEFDKGRGLNDLDKWSLTTPGLNVNACYRPNFTVNPDGKLKIGVPLQVKNSQIPELVDLLKGSSLFKHVWQ